MPSIAPRPERHLHLVESATAGSDDQVAFYDVTASDGTRLQAWTNDPDGSKTGPTVLLCNGLGTNPWVWPILLDPECDVRVVSWYHRGIAGSERPADLSHVGIDAFVEDALAVMDDAGLDSCVLMGWSMGVNTIFELAHLHPDRVDGLFAVGGVPGATFSSMLAPLRLPRFVRSLLTINGVRLMKLAGGPLSRLAQSMSMGPKAGAILTHSGLMLPTPDVENTRFAVKKFLDMDVGWYMHLALASSKHVRVSLRNIDVPTTFVAGKYDVLASSHDMWTASQRVKDSVYVEFPNSHFMPMERPVEVHQALIDLLHRVYD